VTLVWRSGARALLAGSRQECGSPGPPENRFAGTRGALVVLSFSTFTRLRLHLLRQVLYPCHVEGRRVAEQRGVGG
jgi:hypothetical protein